MGTNYYLHTEVCPHCDRPKERVHIGKSSFGWPFLFRGYREWPPDGVPHPITSAQQWRRFMEQAESRGARLCDEYGERVSLDAFWSLVNRKRAETAGPESCKSYRHGERESEWLDAEGYRFCSSEFS